MSKVVTVELPWFNGYRCYLFKTRLNRHLQSKIPRDLTDLLNQVHGELLREGYSVYFAKTAQDRYRGSWVQPLKLRPPRPVVEQALSRGNPVELVYGTDSRTARAVLPLKVRRKSFQALTHFGVRNYSWSKIISLTEVEKQWNPEPHSIEIQISGFGPLKGYNSRLLLSGASSADRRPLKMKKVGRPWVTSGI